MTTTADPDTAATDDDYGVPAATARYLLTELAKLARVMPDIRPVAAQLDGVLDPASIRRPFAGQHVMACGSCGTAMHRSEMRWWPRPMGNAATYRVGCPGCVALAESRLS